MTVFKLPDEIINPLNTGKLVLFIGHDLDFEAYNIPSLVSLTSKIVQKVEGWSSCSEHCRKEGNCLHPTTCSVPFRTASTLYQEREHTSTAPLIDFLNDQLQIQRTPTKLFELIAALPFKAIVTTAYDERLQQAFLAANKRYYPITTDLQIINGQSAETQIIHLYGTLSQTDSLILTKDDHNSLQDKKRLICIWLQALLARDTCLFIDMDFDAPSLQALYSPIIQKLGEIRQHPYVVMTDLSILDIIGGGFHKLATSPLELLQALKEKVNYKPILPPPLPDPQDPYKFLDHFNANDRKIFVGRDFEIHELKNRIITRNLTILFAYSGMGKTSLLNAGVIPQLEMEGFQVKYIRLGDDPIKTLQDSFEDIGSENQENHSNKDNLSDTGVITANPVDANLPESQKGLAEYVMVENQETLLGNNERADSGYIKIIDQAEELFTLHTDKVPREFAELLISYVNRATLNTHIVLSLRTEYLGQLEDLFSSLGHANLLNNRFRLGPLKPEDARQAIQEPASLFKFRIDDELIESILDYLAMSNFDPSQLQIICYQLYKNAKNLKLSDDLVLTSSNYKELGGANGILVGFLDRALEEIGGEEAKTKLKTILKNMITSERTKAVLSEEEISRRVEYAHLSPDDVKEMLQELQSYRIIRSLESGTYELVHDVLVTRIWAWLDEKDIARLNAVQSLRQAMADYELSHRLMTEDKLIAVQQAAPALTFSSKELALLLMSSLSAEQYGKPKDWVDYIKKHQYEEVLNILLEAQTLELLDLHEYALRAEVLLMPTYIQKELLEGIDHGFDEHEIKQLALYLSFDVEQLNNTRREMINEIIQYFIQYSRVDFLLSTVRWFRPHILNKYKFPPPLPSEEYKLVLLLRERFNFKEMRELISYFQIKPENLALGGTLSNLAYQLVISMRRQHKLDHLQLVIASSRPDIGLSVVKEASKILRETYDVEQLRTLCFKLSLDYENFPSRNKDELAYELSDSMNRENRMGELVDAILFPEQVGQDRFEVSLHRLLASRMNYDHLRILCFYMSIDSDNLSGDRLDVKIRELILATKRESKVSVLLTQITKKWPDIFPEQEVREVIQISTKERGSTLNVLQTVLGEPEIKEGSTRDSEILGERIDKPLPLRQSLRMILQQGYSISEFYSLCMKLNVDYEELNGEILIEKQRELILFLERNQRLNDLKEIVLRDRPHFLPELKLLGDINDEQ